MRILVSRLIVPAVIAALAGPAAAEERALLVGIDKYEPPINSLPGIDKDMAAMQATVKLLGFKPAQVKVLMGTEASKGAIIKAIDEWLVKGVGPNDRALFYYSGHGTRVTDLDGDEADGMDEALVPADVRKGAKGWENVLIDDEFGPMLRRVQGREVLAFIDACHSGTLNRGGLTTDVVSKFWRPEADAQFNLDDAATGKALEDGAVADGQVSKALDSNVVIVSAANEKQTAAATPNGSVFTVGMAAIVEYALKEKVPLSANDIREATDLFIAKVFANRPQVQQTPTVDGNPKLAAANLLAPAPAAASRPTTAPTTAPTAAPVVASATRPPAAPTKPPAAATKPPAPPATTAPVSAPAHEGPAWAQLDDITRQAKFKVTVRPGNAVYKVGQNLTIKIDITQDGYLNVLNVGAGDEKPVVLFPNEFHPDNAVKAGTAVEIPGAGAPFKLPASLPAGASEQRALVLVTLSKKPLNAFKSASGAGAIRELTEGATRAFTVEAARPETGGYGAGQFVVVIRK
jgi:metacaspase-1